MSVDKEYKIGKVIGHRGACGYAPENTLASMRKAAELGVQMVEFDVKLTKDKQLVVVHDDDVNRTSNGRGEVASLTYQQISQLDAGSWFHADYADQRIPLFKDILQELQSLRLGFNVEIKPTSGSEIETSVRVLEELEEYWPASAPPPIVSSFQYACLQKTREINDEVLLGYLTRWLPSDWQKVADELNCYSVHLYHLGIRPEEIESIKQTGRKVFCYTVNAKRRASTLFDWGVDAVYSDFPNRVV